jgi:DNA-binding transcriptional ArsR family regulator
MVRALALDVPDGVKVLLIALASFAKDDGTDVFPAVTTLADMTSTTPRAVRRQLAWLRDRGLIAIEAEGGGRGRTTRYQLRTETLTRPTGLGDGNPDPPDRVRDGNPDRPGSKTLTAVVENPDPSVSRIVKTHQRKEDTTGAPATTADDEPERDVLAYLASVGATVQPNGNGFHRRLIRLVDRRGADAVLGAMRRLHAADPTLSDRQLIFGAEDALEPTPKPTRRANAVTGVNREQAIAAFERG